MQVQADLTYRYVHCYFVGFAGQIRPKGLADITSSARDIRSKAIDSLSDLFGVCELNRQMQSRIIKHGDSDSDVLI